MWGYVTRLPATAAERRVRLTSFPPRRPRSRTCRARPGSIPITRRIPRQQPPLGNQGADSGIQPLQRQELSRAVTGCLPYRGHRAPARGVGCGANTDDRPQERQVLGSDRVPGTAFCILHVFTSSVLTDALGQRCYCPLCLTEGATEAHRGRGEGDSPETSGSEPRTKWPRSPLTTTATQEMGHLRTCPLSEGRNTQPRSRKVSRGHGYYF